MTGETTNAHTIVPTANGKNVTFVAPNGMRVNCPNWASTCDKFNSDILMSLIFNDPLLETE